MTDVGALRADVLVCAELRSLERARAYGKDGAHLVARPSAAPLRPRWTRGSPAAGPALQAAQSRYVHELLPQ